MSVTPHVLTRFRTQLAASLGLAFEEHRWAELTAVLERRLRARELTVEGYLALLARPVEASAELRTLVSELTVGETYFFRNSAQLRALVDIVLPERSRVRQDKLRVLCAGCASGEEAYSLAILLREHLPEGDFEVVAIDANPVALQRAARAHYSAWSLRETPDDVRERWFTREGQDFLLSKRIVESVRFEERNLAQAHPDLFLPQHFDVVFFRNVFMYFTHETARAVIARMAAALLPGGYLFIGHAETLRGMSSAFHLRHSHETFYYQRKLPDEDAASVLPESQLQTNALWLDAADGGKVESAPFATESIVEQDGSWVDTIKRSSSRIAQLAEPQAARVPGAPLQQPALDLRHALALLQEERFAEALQAVEALPGSDTHGDGLLLRAVLLTHSGQLQAAESATSKLLQLDELHAGAHYLRALCREGNGDRAGAIWHDQTAIYLDPGFAMPHLHLGLLARRSADLDAARRELSQALLLLEREDAARVLFFGGGFGRDMLIKLCRAELVASGAAA